MMNTVQGGNSDDDRNEERSEPTCRPTKPGDDGSDELV